MNKANKLNDEKSFLAEFIANATLRGEVPEVPELVSKYVKDYSKFEKEFKRTKSMDKFVQTILQTFDNHKELLNLYNKVRKLEIEYYIKEEMDRIRLNMKKMGKDSYRLKEQENILEDTMIGCTCQKCGKVFGIDTKVSDAIWEKIKPVGKPQGGGLLCPICVMEELIKSH